jgi:hypothetical protein
MNPRCWVPRAKPQMLDAFQNGFAVGHHRRDIVACARPDATNTDLQLHAIDAMHDHTGLQFRSWHRKGSMNRNVFSFLRSIKKTPPMKFRALLGWFKGRFLSATPWKRMRRALLKKRVRRITGLICRLRSSCWIMKAVPLVSRQHNRLSATSRRYA